MDDIQALKRMVFESSHEQKSEVETPRLRRVHSSIPATGFEWVAESSALLVPLVDSMVRYISSAQKLHGGDAAVRLRCAGRGTVTQIRLWAYVRDDRAAASTEPPAVFFRCSRDRRPEWPRAHLQSFSGVLQAAAYAGFEQLYNERIREAACWAGVRRNFHEIRLGPPAPIAVEALERIGRLYAVENDLRGRLPAKRAQIRSSRAGPELDSLQKWLGSVLPTLSKTSDLAFAIRYVLFRWRALTRYCDDGRVEIDNKAAERALRDVVPGRDNCLLVGSGDDGERVAMIHTLIGTAKLNGLNPERYVRHVLQHIVDHPADQIDELMPWNVASRFADLRLAY